MRRKRMKTVIVIGMTGIYVLISSPIQAHQPVDMLSCGDSLITVITSGEDLTILGQVQRGILLDNLPAKVFNDMTFQAVGVVKIQGGGFTATVYGKYMDQSGDFFVVDIRQVGMERNWKFIYGTGKWKGISGGGKGYPATNGRPILPGTDQGCF
jgi:hypothetical protein